MFITVNGNANQLPEKAGRSIASLLEELDVSQRLYVTVELNGTILESGALASTPVAQGDLIEFLYFMGGGQSSC